MGKRSIKYLVLRIAGYIKISYSIRFGGCVMTPVLGSPAKFIDGLQAVEEFH
jgi:hypothetical protein